MVGLSGLAITPLIANDNGLTRPKKQQLFISASGANEQTYGCSWSRQQANTLSNLRSGFRGHSVGVNPTDSNQSILFGRRPSRQLMQLNIATAQVTKKVSCEKNRHFFGHGCFSLDGQTLFTTEACLETGKGLIGVRDTKSLEKIREFESYGIGPHEIKLMPNGKSLVVANGGILTRPETGRKKLNLASMSSNLSYINSVNGSLIEQAKVSEPKASIRHIDVARDGTVALSLQVQRSACGHNRTVALAGSHSQGKDVLLFDKPETLLAQMKDYVGSVAIHSKNRIAGFTSPRGNLVAFWNIDNGTFIGYHQLQDVCGVCVTQDQSHFVISNSNGQLRFLNPLTLVENVEQRLQLIDTRWDNHLTSVVI